MTSSGTSARGGQPSSFGRRGAFVELYVRPEVEKFGQQDAAKLDRYLSDLDNSTSIYPIDSLPEVQLDSSGRTVQGEYRYTRAGFRQVSKLLMPGLSTLVPALGGMVQRSNDTDEMIDGHEARRIFNRIIELRFPMLRGQRILRNERAKLIEGILGSSHRFLENRSLFQEARERIADGGEATFVAAVNFGRRMAVWFKVDEPLFTVGHGTSNWTVSRGYYFSNGEVAGSSVRATTVLYTRHGPCLAPYVKFGARVVHSGKDFNRRLGGMFETVLKAELPVDELRRGTEAMFSTSLGFENLFGKERAKRSRVLANSLSQLGVPLRLAEEVVEAALLAGRAEQLPTQPPVQLERDLAGRCVVDMFVPLLRVARKLDLDRRERLEQAAFEILTGKLVL